MIQGLTRAEEATSTGAATHPPEDALTDTTPGAFGHGQPGTREAVTAAAEDGIGPTGPETKSADRPFGTTTTVEVDPADPLGFGLHRRDNVTRRQMKIDHPSGNRRLLKKYYTRQNKLIDDFLGAEDEERLQVAEDARVAPKIKFAVNASFVVNFCLFAIQLYAAISTGSLSVNGPGPDAFRLPVGESC